MGVVRATEPGYLHTPAGRQVDPRFAVYAPWLLARTSANRIAAAVRTAIALPSQSASEETMEPEDRGVPSSVPCTLPAFSFAWLPELVGIVSTYWPIAGSGGSGASCASAVATPDALLTAKATNSARSWRCPGTSQP